MGRMAVKPMPGGPWRAITPPLEVGEGGFAMGESDVVRQNRGGLTFRAVFRGSTRAIPDLSRLWDSP